MDYRRIDTSQIEKLWKLQKAYKAEIGEDEPGERECARLAAAIQHSAWEFDGL